MTDGGRCKFDPKTFTLTDNNTDGPCGYPFSDAVVEVLMGPDDGLSEMDAALRRLIVQMVCRVGQEMQMHYDCDLEDVKRVIDSFVLLDVEEDGKIVGVSLHELFAGAPNMSLGQNVPFGRMDVQAWRSMRISV